VTNAGICKNFKYIINVKCYSYTCLEDRLLKMAGASRNMLKVSKSDNKLLIDVNVVLC